jgi:hypothetical protein
MSELDRGTDRAGRRGKRFLSPSQKYEIYLQLVGQEVTIAEAAAERHVDRSTIMRIRTVAKEGALAALAASKPGGGGPAARPRAGAGQGRERAAVRGAQGDGGQADAHRGKRRLGLSGQVPTRVDAATRDRQGRAARPGRRGARGRLDAAPSLQPARVGRAADASVDRPPCPWTLGRPGPGRVPDARAARRRGRTDPGAVRRVGRDRPVAPQARPPRLLSGPGVGVSVVGA